MGIPVIYDDGRIACDEHCVHIRWYYLWGHKRIPYSSLSAVTRRRMTRLRGRWRIWGSGDFRHFYNLDGTRPRKTSALDLEVGKWPIPVITPDDPDRVEQILRARMPSATR